MSRVRGNIRRTSVELVEAKRFANSVGNELLSTGLSMRRPAYRTVYKSVLY